MMMNLYEQLFNCNPEVKVTEGENDYTYQVRAVGVKKEDLTVGVKNGYLIIDDKGKDEEPWKDDVSMSLLLPRNGIDTKGIKATINLGILTIRIPKGDDPNILKIEVE